MISLRAGAATDVGLVRSNNQDQLLVADPLYAVADGMGGAAAGEVASALAVEALEQEFNGEGRPTRPTPDLLITAAQAANRAVWEEAEANPEMRGMGTTLVALALVEGPQLAVVNIGDSRLYNLRGGVLRQVTYDHNLVAEMVAEGRISKEEAEVHPRRNIMTRALGVEPEVPIDLFLEEPLPGDRYLLCSDGLPRELSDDMIAALLRRLADPADAAKQLVEEAKARGGNDNITVVVVDVAETGTAPPPGADAADATTVVRAPADAGPPPRRETTRPVTFRVVGFVVLFLLIVGAGVAGVIWYARSAYFVGLRGDQIVIYQGRPGGVLWLKPTVSEVTGYTTADVLPVHVPTLRSGQQETSVSAAKSYVRSLVDEKRASTGAAAPPSVTSPGPPGTT